jgi:hypothetical protein
MKGFLFLNLVGVALYGALVVSNDVISRTEDPLVRQNLGGRRLFARSGDAGRTGREAADFVSPWGCIYRRGLMRPVVPWLRSSPPLAGCPSFIM